ncbi:hypothetical protein FHS18_006779 [Paenibacillus phyllosphaerae]|uniref:Uncharacterized protein n=1 Tax=Paenibacillus phyllosphaerae TaxID=274593 RepID=A0A7W5FRL1_9BACL|nr:hypothetical protein [Paenibacillus phyllosphaerae]
MDKQFIDKLQTLSRRDEVRSSLLLEGVKRTLRQRKQRGFIRRILHSKKKTIVPKSWD